MPTLPEIKPNQINSLIAFLGGKETQKAYLKHLRDPQIQDSAYLELEEEFKQVRNINTARQCLAGWRKKKIEIVSIEEELYPEKLKKIHNPPLILFVKGKKENFSKLKDSLAIVGSRSADIFGCEKSREFGRFAASRGICVVSGLALGIDTFAHKGALESSIQLPTIAVLGNGLHRIFPSENCKLAESIIESGGLILSHFSPEINISRYSFLDRNRIISGLSDATLVIQAPRKSGALNTAMHALDESRDLLIMPGAVNDPLYVGSNALMRKGAGIICEASDILDYFPNAPINIESSDQLKINFTPDQSLVIKQFKEKVQLHIDELGEIFKDNSKLAITLLDLEIAGVLKQEPGNYIRLTSR